MGRPFIALTLLASLLVAGGIAWLVPFTADTPAATTAAPQSQPEGAGGSPRTARPRAPARSTETDALTPRIAGHRPGAGLPESAPIDGSPVYASGRRVVYHDALLPHEFTRQALNYVVEQLSPADLQVLEREADEGDGEAAFLLHQYYLRCASAPYSAGELEEREDQLIDAAAQNPEAEEWVLQNFHLNRRLLELCAPFSIDQATVLQQKAFRALRRSALLGYLPGIVEYAQSGFHLIMNQALHNPDVLWDYRSSALSSLQRAIDSGHPEALVTRAHLSYSGRFEEPDPVAAYAYARAAKLISVEVAPRVDPLLTAVGNRLDPAQMREAREMARRLCDRLCR